MTDPAGVAAGAPTAGVPPRVRWAVAAGTRLLRTLARTWRVQEIGREGWNARRASGGGLVVAIWHGQMLPLLAHHRNEGVSILISEHRDGEIIARVVRAFGFATVRGSSSRGGTRALLELVSVLRRGGEIGVTPDGPRGPRHTFAPGALVAANRAGVPVVGIVAHVDRSWRLSSWDGFEIPKPFARIVVAYGEPRMVDGATAREAAERVPEFAAMMDTLRARAESVARGAS
ncbi:MAG: lysophospholipid acyltransferase family protein [Gemmatirosa sp.]